MRKFLTAILLTAVSGQAFGESQLFLDYQPNRGEHVFELGSRFPDITGYSGGSRLTYPRDFNMAGLGISAGNGPFFMQLGFRTTGRYVDTGTARDEDFNTNYRSREQGAKIDLRRGEFHDNVNTFSGTQNWADAKARSSMSGYEYHFSLRMYLTDGTGGGWLRKGFYLISGARYTYFKYIVYDVIQFVDSRPLYLGPIGAGLTFSNRLIEIPLGIGYNLGLGERNSIDASFQAVAADAYSRDYHFQRGINFLTESQGGGFLINLDWILRLQDKYFLKLGFYSHHIYTRGAIHTTGLNYVYNFSPPQRAYLNTKEAGIHIQIARALF